MNAVIVCGQPESPDLDPLDSDLPDNETMMAKDPLSLSNVERISASSKHEVKNDDNLSVSTTSSSLKDSESSATTATDSNTSYTSNTSSEYSQDDSESSSSDSIYTSTPLGNYGNYMLAPYVAIPTRSRKRLRGRRLNFDDLSSDSDPLECSVDESESAEPKAKRVAVAEWINDMEQFYALKKPKCSSTEDEE
ncbi:suppressor protein SRP40-like [Bactrocera tryoni]|uniref:suppressor protein SRP40-like n=1 Tax=Bactrocera tryoni TaxID=59916 RepID=UPI001A9606C7|nr:suppressor protein SRP40-like [Bactrocera tryoni]